MIPEPQRTHLLELLTALGPAADGLILVGGQAARFMVAKPRATRDLDFVLDVAYLRHNQAKVAPILAGLGYSPVDNARNFQFEKPIPNSAEAMRIEFLAPAEFGGRNQIRVDVQEGIHGRACAGGSIVLTETDEREITGSLPSGAAVQARVHVTRPHALVMLKLIAMDERYRNIRGAPHAEHDREEARIHAGDIVAILNAQPDLRQFREMFTTQFREDIELKNRTNQIIRNYFGERSAPGVVLYSEALVQDRAADSVRDLDSELRRAQRLVSFLLLEA
ncbi:MAG: nucleotidyl transferase AbiEii/AbiGii toxin family protein [Acidobacteriota bacterium]|nr:nucleotidyl transferase AbiEii/AbiGii toxin family protein [Acidobacteriota bacterium]